MNWRRFKMDWPRTLGEMMTIVLGVLIALAVDQWNEERLERAEETAAIEGIIAELQEDLRRLDARLGFLEAKEASLLRVQDAFSRGSVDDGDRISLLRDVVVGADFGWNQGLASRATYDDLVNSGKLAIVESSVIRLAIADYYQRYEDEHNRIDERETDYPNLSYRLVPRTVSTTEDLTVFESGLESGLSERRTNDLVSLVLESSLGDVVTAELNLARFIRSITISTQVRAQTLIDRLKEYQVVN